MCIVTFAIMFFYILSHLNIDKKYFVFANEYY